MAMGNEKAHNTALNDEITSQIKRLTRENGIAWLARTCKTILTELADPKKVNVCRNLCNVMELIENDEGEKNGYLQIIKLLDAEGEEEILMETQQGLNENDFEGFNGPSQETKTENQTEGETKCDQDKKMTTDEIVETNEKPHSKKENTTTESQQNENQNNKEDSKPKETKESSENVNTGNDNKDKSPEGVRREICNYWLRNKCRYGTKCKNIHPVRCTNTMEWGKCTAKECEKYHPKICWNYGSRGHCSKGNWCPFLHPSKIWKPKHIMSPQRKNHEINNWQQAPPRTLQYPPPRRNQRSPPLRNTERTNGWQKKPFLEIEERMKGTELLYEGMMKGMKNMEEKISWMMSRHRDLEMLETRRKLNFPYY